MESEVDIVVDKSAGSTTKSVQRVQSSEARTSASAVTRPQYRKDEDVQLKERAKLAQAKYGRGQHIRPQLVKDKKLRSNLRSLEKKYKDATLKAKDAEILLEHDAGYLEADGELERTYKVRQDDIKPHIGISAAQQGFALKLTDKLGPYTLDYTPNGKGLLLSGRHGHVAAIPDWRAGKLGCELQLGEEIREARWLHNEQYFAVAQKKYMYIYDSVGVELHCLKQHIDVLSMEFLRYHFLLASIGRAGWLKYTDTSTGRLVAEMSTKQGTPCSLTQNPANAIMHVGHQNGTVTLWSPNSTSPLVKVLAHRGPVRAVAVDREGRYMVTTGQDMKMGIWDIRMYKQLHEHFLRRPGSSLAISDRGLCAVGWGTQVSVWKDIFTHAPEAKAQSPYMSWGGQGQTISRLRFCPFEDVLGISHSHGISSIIVPGAGEPNYDALELNPYESVKQRQEREVSSLLNKLQPEMIDLNPDFVGRLDRQKAEQYRQQADLDRAKEDPLQKIKEKNRGRGKNSSLRKYLRAKSRKNVVDETRLRVEELRKETNRKTRKGASNRETDANVKDDLAPALARFARKR